jgi:hypothetical protein
MSTDTASAQAAEASAGGPAGVSAGLSAELSVAEFRDAMGHFATGSRWSLRSMPTASRWAPPAPQQHLSRNFARRGLAATWDGIRHRRGPTGSPRLEDMLAALECTVEHVLPGGDHEIVVGRVCHVETSVSPRDPLVFFRGGYASLLPPSAGSGFRPPAAGWGPGMADFS